MKSMNKNTDSVDRSLRFAITTKIFSSDIIARFNQLFHILDDRMKFMDKNNEA
jgi:hypothetical protein